MRLLTAFILSLLFLATTQTGVAFAAPLPLTVNLNKLKVAGEVNSPKYARQYFKHWVDADGDGCDTRKEVLAVESLVKIDCASPYGGVWYSEYDAQRITDPRKLDIDHMIPLKEAWQSGAYRWTAKTRERYANDLNYAHAVIAVTLGSNRSKGARDLAEWTPPDTSSHCWYVASWIAVKYRWSLTADPREKAAAARLIRANKCKATRLPRKALIQLQPVKPPATPNPPATTPTNDGAIALCNDGTKSYASSHSGACSGHDGVQCWYDYATSTTPLCPGAIKATSLASGVWGKFRYR